MEAEALAGVFLGGATAASLRDGASQTALFSERVVGDGDPSQHHPIRDPVRSTEHNFWPNDSVVHCAAVSSAQPHLSYTGWTWLSNDYSQTAYNHCLTPNSQIPDCFDGWNEIRVGQGAMTARSWHAAGVSVAFADGAVKFINEAIDLKIWRGLGSISGQELIDEF